MMLIRSLDRWLLEKVTEPVAWWLARRLGCRLFDPARLTCVAFAAGSVANAMAKLEIFYFLLAALATAAAMFRATWAMSKLERDVSDLHAANPEKHFEAMQVFRPVLIAINGTSAVLCVVAWKLSAADVGNVCGLLHFYFAACDHPPPQAQEARGDINIVPEAT